MVEYSLLFLSIMFNVLFVWYNRKLLSNLLYVSENLNDLYDEMVIFRDHIDKVYEMELFYGDETLKNLLRHAKYVSGLIESYEHILLLSDYLEEEEEDGEGTE